MRLITVTINFCLHHEYFCYLQAALHISEFFQPDYPVMADGKRTYMLQRQ